MCERNYSENLLLIIYLQTSNKRWFQNRATTVSEINPQRSRSVQDPDTRTEASMESREAETDGVESDRRLELRRRTLAKMAGVAGVGMVTGWSFSGVVSATNSREVSITMNVQPLDNRVLVQEVTTEEKTDGGIIVPDETKGNEEGTREGIVRAVGTAAEQVTEGDNVLFTDGGTEVVIGGEDHLIVPESELLAIIND